MTLENAPQSRLSDAYMLMMRKFEQSFCLLQWYRPSLIPYASERKVYRQEKVYGGERYLHDTWSIPHERRRRLYSRLLGSSINFSRSIPVKSSAIHSPFSCSVALWKASARRIDWTSRSVTYAFPSLSFMRTS